eukprot:gb/GEZN01014238.1/.p1 GENE.gb/GEZN01014238.1/~~gb/GEZN01014238.1/.p1  ORF type:complete len:224 (+),score=10.57 gb/GEZN01014238.1/:142-813(+)
MLLVMLLPHPEKPIKVRGAHLDSLSRIDIAFITFNRLTTIIFTYHLLQYTYNNSLIPWNIARISIANTVTGVLCCFIMYDFFYNLFHRFLHLRSVYGYVHKHHHRQKAPTRGNTDAINVHPFEFVSGEYNHLFAIFLVNRLGLPVHFLAVLVFVGVGGILASLNHTRYDIELPWLMYQVKAHDLHHWYPTANYSQYTTLWDHVFGSFRPHPDSITRTGLKASD